MQVVTEIMAASMLLEAAVAGDSLGKVIKGWRKRGCSVPAEDEKALVQNFGQRKTLDALKIVVLHFVMEYARKMAKDPELFKNMLNAKKPDDIPVYKVHLQNDTE